MKYDFNTVYDRRQGSKKWNAVKDFNEIIVPFSVADMEFITAPEIREELSNYVKNSLLGYTTYTDEYLDEVVKWQKNMHDINIDKSYIVSTPGVVTAIYHLLLALTEENDGVIIFPPVYNPFKFSIDATKRKTVNCPLINEEGYYTIDFNLFEKLASESENKALIFCNPHNPVGRVWTKDELEKVAEIAKKHNLLIICDEIWSDITVRGYKTYSMFNAASDYLDNTVICTAASKTFNLAGLQCSNIIIKNKEKKRLFIAELEKTHISVNAFGYEGTLAAYRYGKEWMDEMLQVIEENYNFAKDFLEKNFNGVVISPLEGTYVIWADFRFLNMDKEKLETFLKEKAKFYSTEGYVFGKEGEGFERINIACPKSALKSGLLRLKEAVSKY